MTNQTPTLVAWLRDAHAMERASVDTLDHLAERLGRPYPDLGSDTSTFKDLRNRFIGIAQAYAVELLPDELVKDCLAAYASRHFEIATYISLGAAARKLQQPAIVQMCEKNLQQERAMASWLEQQIPETTLEFLRP